MPAQAVLLNGTIWTLFYFLITYLAFDMFYAANGIGPVYTALGILLGIPSFFIGSIITYHSIDTSGSVISVHPDRFRDVQKKRQSRKSG